MISLSDVALVVLNYNSAHDTLYCVEKLLSFGSDFHIIVVDNMSPDGSFDEIKEKLGGSEQVDVIQSDRNGGYSYGNNFGMRYAIEHYGSTVLGILNPDVIIPRLEVISVMKQQLESDPTFAVIGGSCILSERVYKLRRSGWFLESPYKMIILHCALLNKILGRKRKELELLMLDEKLAQVDCVIGCFFLAKTHVMEEIGFLDENVFMYHEENILGIRIKRAGYKEVLALDQFYIHNHHKEPRFQKMSFNKKIHSSKFYPSLKYLIKTYYSPAMLPLLWVVEGMNRLYHAIAWVIILFIKKK